MVLFSGLFQQRVAEKEELDELCNRLGLQVTLPGTAIISSFE